MEKKHSKKHRHDSSSDEEVRHRKHHKHHHNRDREGQSNSNRRHNSPDQHSRKHRKDHSRRRQGRHAEYDPNLRIKQEKDEENFQHQQRERSNYDARRREQRQERERDNRDFGLNNESEPVVKDESNAEVEPEPKQNPNFELSGKLTEDTNTFRGVVIKYNEPPEAMMPKRKWRLYPFKGQTALPVLHIHRQSAFLLGRDRKIADIPVDHPSCSKQQAVLQFRAVSFTRDDGTMGRRVRPFIIDLESANGTFLNNEKIEVRRYYELKEKDVIKFGFSTREYVLLHDNVDLSEVAGGDVDEM